MRFALPEIGIKLGLVSATITGLTIFEAAMIAEIVRGGWPRSIKGKSKRPARRA